MASQFDMNQPPMICGICREVHPMKDRCNYDRLVKLVSIQKQEVIALIKANSDLFKSAKSFRDIIREMSPKLEQAHIFKTAFEKVMSIRHDKNDIYSDIQQEMNNGAEELQAATSQMQFEGVQSEAGQNPGNVPDKGVEKLL